jgi:predicted phosphodiesterase
VARKPRKPKALGPPRRAANPAGRVAALRARERPLFTLERSHPDCVSVRVPMRRRVDWEFWALVLSDEHWDNPKCERDMLRRDLDEAARRNAVILSFGDFFCAMQGKYDRRSNIESVRPEHRKTNYLGSLVETAAQWLAPYANRYAVLGQGNHESSVLDRNGFNLTTELAGALRGHGFNGHAGNYAGWVRFMFDDASFRSSVDLRYTHGYGGGGPVTKDMIQANRQSVVYQADIIVSGHTHDRWVSEQTKMALNASGVPKRRTQWQIKTGTYKDAIGTGGSSWEDTKGHPPKPLGAVWIRFGYDPQTESITVRPMAT